MILCCLQGNTESFGIFVSEMRLGGLGIFFGDRCLGDLMFGLDVNWTFMTDTLMQFEVSTDESIYSPAQGRVVWNGAINCYVVIVRIYICTERLLELHNWTI